VATGSVGSCYLVGSLMLSTPSFDLYFYPKTREPQFISLYRWLLQQREGNCHVSCTRHKMVSIGTIIRALKSNSAAGHQPIRDCSMQAFWRGVSYGIELRNGYDRRTDKVVLSVRLSRSSQPRRWVARRLQLRNYNSVLENCIFDNFKMSKS
jgi:hypothetical protein